LNEAENKSYRENIVTPACVKACPADCLRFGDRDEMLQVARDCISGHPEKYVDHIYGEKEAGGTSVLYLSSVPFEKIGFPDVGTKPYPGFSKLALHAVPPAVMAVGALLASTYALLKRRASAIAGDQAETSAAESTAITPSLSPSSTSC
jgi:formate dehydrogenase iron-sulfur subunit